MKALQIHQLISESSGMLCPAYVTPDLEVSKKRGLAVLRWRDPRAPGLATAIEVDFDKLIEALQELRSSSSC